MSKINIISLKLQRVVLCLLILTYSICVNSQSIIDEIDNSDDGSIPSLATENIKKISDSRRVFLITNESESFTKGDYISLVFTGKLVARAIAVKLRTI